ncbi:MAG: pyridoxal-phosphate dependent enzyme [Desulfurococcaceae archaeon]
MKWRCNYCGFEEDSTKQYYWKCPKCSNPLTIVYTETGEIYSSMNTWERYIGFTPLKPEKTRGEGLTPLVVEREGSHSLLFKLEYLNPGGSFKDRGTALAVYYGYRMGFKETLVDTSGNTGISVTLYSRLYGLRANIIMPKTAPIGKKKAVLKLGGNLIEAENRTHANELVAKYINDSKTYYVAHLWNPLYIVGHATISYEVYEEYGVPDYIIAPIGSGGLILALSHGFSMLIKHNLAKKKPRLIGVQGYSCQPVYETLKGEKNIGEESNLADGILVENPPRRVEIADTIKNSGGDIVLVGNTEIEKAHRELWEYGFLVEPTSATVYAAYEKIRNKLPDNVSILLVLTGSGLKTL